MCDLVWAPTASVEAWAALWLPPLEAPMRGAGVNTAHTINRLQERCHAFLRDGSSAAMRGLGDVGVGAGPDGGPPERGDITRAPRGDSVSVCVRDMDRNRTVSATLTAATCGG